MPWIAVCLLSWAFLQQPPAPPPKGEATSRPADRAEPAPARPGFVPVGTVWFNPEHKVVEADGYFNLRAGFVEYLAATPGTKRHETLVALECSPEHLQGALLLLGLEPGKGPETEFDLRPIEGPRVIILLRWSETTADGTVRVVERRAEDCLLNGLVDDTMDRVGWVFTGSRFVQDPASFAGPGGVKPAAPTEPPPGSSDPPADSADSADEAEKPREVFGAAATGELVATCHRPLAILDHPLGIPFPDADYYAYPDVLPPTSRENPTRVTMVFRLPREQEIDRSVTLMRVPPRPDTQPATADPKSESKGATGGKQ
ncbi:MAG: YdjY domain-containing protein [Planctomycetota bacterium]